MDLTQARNEIYEQLCAEGETELAEAWKEVGNMMEAGLSGEEVMDVLVHRRHRALGKAIEKFNLKELT